MRKQAILVVSFGTTHLETLQKNITSLEQTIAEAFPNQTVFRAFTSPVIRRILDQRFEIRVPGVEEAVEQILQSGYEEITVQPALLIPGGEYDRLVAALREYEGRIEIRLGLPLLWAEQDLDVLLEIVKKNYVIPKDSILLMVGHGTEHPANWYYVALAEKMKNSHQSRMRLCTVDATPSFQEIVRELQCGTLRNITAVPLMLVAGNHAKNDMMGESSDSLCSQLKAAGFSVTCRMEGMGHLVEIQQLYCQRIRQAQLL